MTKKPKPEPETEAEREWPRDWMHHHAKHAEHLNRLEARLVVVEAVLKGLDQTDAWYTPPPGVVSPHVRENLEALAEWAEYLPTGATDPMGILANMRRLIGIALEGGDVPRMVRQ